MNGNGHEGGGKMVKVTINLELEVDNSVSVNELKATIEAMAEEFTERINEINGVIEAELSKTKIVI